jgi:hypothetical protein
MAVNLLGTIKNGIPGSFAAMAGGFLGESGASTGAALTSLLPVLMATVARSGTAAGGTKGVLAMLANPSVDTGILPNLNSIFAAGGAQANSMSSAGSALASSIFGERFAPLATALGSMAGFTKPSSAQKLVALAVPIALAFLKRFVGANGLSADRLASLLAGQRPFLDGTLDGRLTAALGYAEPAAMLATLRPPIDDRPEAAADEGVGAAAKTVDSQRPDRSGFAQRCAWLVGAIVVLYALSRLMALHETPGTPIPVAAPTSVPGAAPPIAAPSSTTPPASGAAAGGTPTPANPR